MFTGIVTDLGAVMDAVQGGAAAARFRIRTAYEMDGVAIGASISCNGCCLTVVEKGPDWFAVDASRETLDLTTLGTWTAGMRVNLERALKAGDELGGHIVSGHVDGLAVVEDIRDEDGSKRFTVVPPADLSRFIAPKGSVALDGVSLTVNEVGGNSFGVNIIPHTQAVTTFGALRVGDRLNMEIDQMARYVARLLDTIGK
ncbi:MAG: riboflavin synthase [Rhodospirillaceae bacterium]|nr:riboflavin synthase [Rhodospirillaceae bacterium]